MKRRLKVAIALFVTLPVLIIVVQIVRRVGVSNDRPERVSAVPVIVGEPSLGDLENSILYPGTLTPDKTVGLRKNGAERIIIRGNAFLEDGQPVVLVAGP